jgi:hypothetical protein
MRGLFLPSASQFPLGHNLYSPSHNLLVCNGKPISFFNPYLLWTSGFDFVEFSHGNICWWIIFVRMIRSQTQLQTSWSIKPMWMTLALQFEEWLIMNFLGHPLSTDVRIMLFYYFSLLLFYQESLFASLGWNARCFSLFLIWREILFHSGNILLKKRSPFYHRMWEIHAFSLLYRLKNLCWKCLASTFKCPIIAFS